MRFVDTTYSSTSCKGDELSSIPMLVMFAHHMSNFMILQNMVHVSDDHGWMEDATRHTKSEMRCEVDDLMDQLQFELLRTKRLLREKYPWRHRFAMFKVMLRYPLTSIWYLTLYTIEKIKNWN